ncbi:hypothetical protein [Lysobacter sp. ESA13C]|uniref:hypothetical protein n=1 Tax=Lysobacter sp. ESA13C TaxID=2862676 RepID=UPI001CBF3967|nr:hypothetical protein [Lysobacter sp. ESA13C]
MACLDITGEMIGFKETCRHLWNAALVSPDRAISLLRIQSFEHIERELLKEMVLRRVGAAEAASNYRQVPIDRLLVHPKRFLSVLSVMVGDESQGGGRRWSEEVAIPVDKLSQMAFFDFFDWDMYVHRNFSYVRVVDLQTSVFHLVESCDVDFCFHAELEAKGRA